MLKAMASSGALAATPTFHQSLNPAHSTLGSTLIALIPIVLLLVLLPVLRMSAWQAVTITVRLEDRPPVVLGAPALLSVTAGPTLRTWTFV